MGAQIIDIAAVRTRLKLGLPMQDRTPALVPATVPGVEVGSWVVTPSGLIAFFTRSWVNDRGKTIAQVRAGDGIAQSWPIAELKPVPAGITCTIPTS